MALAPFQWTYRGLTFGDGTDIEVVEVDGFDGFDTRSGDSPVPRGHGDVPGDSYVVGRQIALVLESGIQTAQRRAAILAGVA